MGGIGFNPLENSFINTSTSTSSSSSSTSVGSLFATDMCNLFSGIASGMLAASVQTAAAQAAERENMAAVNATMAQVITDLQANVTNIETQIKEKETDLANISLMEGENTRLEDRNNTLNQKIESYKQAFSDYQAQERVCSNIENAITIVEQCDKDIAAAEQAKSSIPGISCGHGVTVTVDDAIQNKSADQVLAEKLNSSFTTDDGKKSEADTLRPIVANALTSMKAQVQAQDDIIAAKNTEKTNACTSVGTTPGEIQTKLATEKQTLSNLNKQVADGSTFESISKELADNNQKIAENKVKIGQKATIESEIAQLQTELTKAKQELKSAEDIYAQNEVDQAQNDLNTATDQLSAAKDERRAARKEKGLKWYQYLNPSNWSSSPNQKMARQDVRNARAGMRTANTDLQNATMAEYNQRQAWLVAHGYLKSE